MSGRTSIVGRASGRTKTSLAAGVQRDKPTSRRHLPVRSKEVHRGLAGMETRADPCSRVGGSLPAPLSRAGIGRRGRVTGCGVIPAVLDIDRCPGAAADRADALRVCSQPVPRGHAGLDNLLVAVPDGRTKFVLPKVIPNLLHGVQLGTVRRQWIVSRGVV
jgi:hypothetical protein